MGSCALVFLPITMKNGWIKVPRYITEQDWFRNPKVLQLYIYLNMQAATEPRKTVFEGNEITLEKGQFVTGILRISRDLNMPKSTVEHGLKTLQKWAILGRKIGRKSTLISISYSDLENELGPMLGRKRADVGPKLDTIYKNKNNKENKKDDDVTTGGGVEKKYYWDLFRQIQADEMQMELCMKNYKITKQQVTEHLKNFFRLKLSEQYQWPSFADAKRNFYYWLGTLGDRLKEPAPEPELDKDAVRALQDDFYNSRLGPADKPKTI